MSERQFDKIARRVKELEAERDQYALDGSNWYKRTRELEAEVDKLRSQAALNSDYLRHAEAENERLRDLLSLCDDHLCVLEGMLHGEDGDGVSRLRGEIGKAIIESEAGP